MSDAVSVEKAAVDEQEWRLQEAQLKLDGLTKVDKVAASVCVGLRSWSRLLCLQDICKNLAVLHELQTQMEKVKASKQALKESTTDAEVLEEQLMTLTNRENVQLLPPWYPVP